jgi:diacylglycerol O-acyltransferase / wax synthase
MDRHHYLSPVDTAWYRLDEAGNTADIVALITFGAELDHEQVEETVAKRFSQYPQFSQRIADPLGAGLPHWEEAPDFRISDHIHHKRLESGTKQELEDFVSDVLTLELDRTRPLWQIHIVDNVEGGSAIVAKIHHCLGDGFALVGVLLTLSDFGPAPGAQVEASTHEDTGIRAALHSASDLLHHPERLIEQARTGGRVALGLGELMLLPFDSPSCLVRPLTGIRRAAWSSGFELSRFKAIAHNHDCTVNDVLLGALAGALRHWMTEQGDQPDELSIRAVVPVNLRPIEEVGKELGNQFGLVFLDLPVHKGEPTSRLEAVHASMQHLKDGVLAMSSVIILGALGMVPAVVEHLAADVFTRKGSLVVTNVPGPRETIRLAGSPVDHLMFWVPHAARLGLGVSLISYAGEVRIGVRADTGVLPRPELLVEAFEREIERLERI